MAKNTSHVVIHRIHSSDPRLKRHIVHDPRSREFPAKTARSIKSVMHGFGFLPLDQGEIGSCTANAAEGACLTDPYRDKLVGKFTPGEAFALELYHEETELHPHDGVYPPEDPGGCGLWIAKVLKNRGLIQSYRHAFGLTAALKALVLGPVIFGIDWYSSFFNPDKTGLVAIKKGDKVEGGHEIVAIGIDLPNKLVWFMNSWGASWGVTGKFCMSFDTLAALLQNQGDCTQFVV